MKQFSHPSSPSDLVLFLTVCSPVFLFQVRSSLSQILQLAPSNLCLTYPPLTLLFSANVLIFHIPWFFSDFLVEPFLVLRVTLPSFWANPPTLNYTSQDSLSCLSLPLRLYLIAYFPDSLLPISFCSLSPIGLTADSASQVVTQPPASSSNSNSHSSYFCSHSTTILLIHSELWSFVRAIALPSLLHTLRLWNYWSLHRMGKIILLFTV